MTTRVKERQGVRNLCIVGKEDHQLRVHMLGRHVGLDVDKAEARRYYTLIFVRCSNADDKLHESALKYVKEWLRDNGVDETVL